MITDATLCVVNVSYTEIYDFCDGEDAEAILAKANAYREESIATWKSHSANRPEREDFKEYLKRHEESSYKIMTYGEFKEAERRRLLGDALAEITEDRFQDMLDILPPLCWTRQKNVEMFCISEMYTGTYTNQYAHDHNTGKYYTKMVDAADRSTWISEILYPSDRKDG